MNTKRIITAALGLALAATGPSAFASSHREAPLIAEDPSADNVDVYAWAKPGTRDKIYIVANYIPLEEPAGGPNFHKFSDDVRYEIHVTRGTQHLRDAVTYFIEFETSSINYQDPADLGQGLFGGKEFFSQLTGQTQTYSVYKKIGNTTTRIANGIKVAPTRIGPRTYTVVQKGNAASDTYDDAFAASFIHNMGGEGRVFAGPRDDGFYVDLGGVFDLANLRAKGTAQDGVSGYNTHAIVLEIPTTILTGGSSVPNGVSNNNLLGIWAAASRRKISVLRADGSKDASGNWTQVSRLGLPLINEAVIGLQDKDKYNRTLPAKDVANFGAYFLNPIVVRDAEAVGIYGALGVDPTPFKSNRLDIIEIISLKNIPSANAHNVPLSSVGDVLRLDPGVESGFPNGRPLVGGAAPNQEQADVTNVLLSVILAGGQLAISDGVDYNDKAFLADMPFLALPHQGYDEGHGKTTP